MVRISEGPADDAATRRGAADDDRRDGGRAFTRVDLVLVLIVVAATVLRLWKLGSQSLWFDEYLTTQDVSHSLGGMLFSTLGPVEGTPPLYFILTWGWVRVLGDGDTAIRLLSAIVGIATVPMVYAVARELRQSRRVARVAALLVAVNPMLVWFSQEARAYALLVFLASVALFFCVRAQNDDRTSDFVWWGLASAAAVSTHYFAIYLMVPEAVWLLLARRRRWGKVALGFVPLAVVAVPLATLAWSQRGKRNWIADYPLTQRLAETGRQYVLGPPEPYEWLWVPAIVLMVGAVVMVIVRGEPRERITAAIMGALGLAGLVLSLLAMRDYVLGRYLIASVIPLMLAVAIGFGARRAGWLGVAAAVVLCGVWAGLVIDVGNRPELQKPNWRAAADVLATGGHDRLIVIDSYLGDPIVRYLKGSRITDPQGAPKVQAIDLLYRIPTPGGRCGRWSGLICEVFIFPVFPDKLAHNFILVKKLSFKGFILNRYQSSTPVSVRGARFLRRQGGRGILVLPRQ